MTQTKMSNHIATEIDADTALKDKIISYTGGLSIFSQLDYMSVGDVRTNYIHVMCMNSEHDINYENYKVAIEVSIKRNENNVDFDFASIGNVKYDKTIEFTDEVLRDIISTAKKSVYAGIVSSTGIETGFRVQSVSILRPLAGSSEDIFAKILISIDRKICNKL